MGRIGHRNLNNALNRMYSDYQRASSHASYPQVQGKKDVISDVAKAKDKLTQRLRRDVSVYTGEEFSVVGAEDGSIYFVSKMSEEYLKHCWFEKDEAYGRISKDGKVEAYQLGGAAKRELNDEQMERAKQIQEIVDAGMSALENEVAEDKEFRTKTSFQRMLSTVSGKKPKMEQYKKLKSMLEQLPEHLSVQKAETIIDTLKEQTIAVDEISIEAIDGIETQERTTVKKEQDKSIGE